MMTREFVRDRMDEPGDAEWRRNAITRRAARRREQEEHDEEDDEARERYVRDLEAENAILRKQLTEAEKKA